MNVQPLAGALLSVVALREVLRIHTVVGGLLILAGVSTAVMAKRAQRSSMG